MAGFSFHTLDFLRSAYAHREVSMFVINIEIPESLAIDLEIAAFQQGKTLEQVIVERLAQP